MENPVTPDTKIDVFGKSMVTSQGCCIQSLCLFVPKPSSCLKKKKKHLSFDETVQASSGPTTRMKFIS